MYNGFDLYLSSGKSNHENSTAEGVECSVSDRICNFLIYVKSEQGKIYLVPISRKSNIETLILSFRHGHSEIDIPLVRQGLEKQHFLDQDY